MRVLFLLTDYLLEFILEIDYQIEEENSADNESDEMPVILIFVAFTDLAVAFIQLVLS